MVLNWLIKLSQNRLLIIVRGPSGSGKSIISNELSKKWNAPIFSTDDFWTVNGQYEFDADYLDYAHWWNQGRVEQAMQAGVSVIIVDNTNTQFYEMKPYVELAQKYGYHVHFKEPDWNRELKTQDGQWNVDFLELMQTGRSATGKIIPRDVLEGMVNRYEYNPTIESVLNSERSK